jgi:D-3-phosphoglycerate dehydrogenase
LNKKKLLILTPIKHIDGLFELLSLNFNCIYLPNEPINKIINSLQDCDLVFTNPNKSKLMFNAEFFEKAPLLKAIYTASTGTDHIDINVAQSLGIKIFSLANEKKVINELTSTAELAFTFALMAARNVLGAIEHVRNGGWDYEEFIGRQFSSLTVGVVGFGRLGKMFANYCKAFGATVLVYDPFVEINSDYTPVNTLIDLAKAVDVISLHVHHTKETKSLVNSSFFDHCKRSINIINTSRGEIIDELALAKFLKDNTHATYYSDVLSNEILGRNINPLMNNTLPQNQLIITPHIGGMTTEGQKKAFYYTANVMIQEYGKPSDKKDYL